jgi:hypothetical protein
LARFSLADERITDKPARKLACAMCARCVGPWAISRCDESQGCDHPAVDPSFYFEKYDVGQYSIVDGRRAMSIRMDEIARLAKNYFRRHGTHALVLVEDNINRAIGNRRWDDVLKWSRVKRRIMRLDAVQHRSPRKMQPMEGRIVANPPPPSMP